MELRNAMISSVIARRAEETIGNLSVRNVASLSQADLIKLTQALSTVVLASSLGRRPDPMVLAFCRSNGE